jgi:hypothetical protein
MNVLLTWDAAYDEPLVVMTSLSDFAYVLCVFEGEREEKDGEVQKPPKGKKLYVQELEKRK